MPRRPPGRPGRAHHRPPPPPERPVGPVLVSATLGVAGAILIESSLSFLGFGVPPPNATWGNILADGKRYIFDAPWLTLVPGTAILIVVLAFNLFGEGLREAFNPRLREG